ncbi:MAG TPA: PIN domain nuclease [Desulfotomaculum sp.]|nr:PIN domain nuclease [Desulfotomaculum sp.]
MGIKDFLKEVERFPVILIDTNIAIYLLEDIPVYGKGAKELFRLVQVGKIKAFLSVITAIELLVRPMKAENEELVNNIKLFLNHFPNLKLINVSKEIALKAAEIRAATNLKVPDAIIIASAVVNSCPVAGNDLEWARKNLMIPYIYLGKYLEP